MEKRILSAEELMPEYTELLKAGAELPLSVSGASMLPFLYPGRDAVFLKRRRGNLNGATFCFTAAQTADTYSTACKKSGMTDCTLPAMRRT